MLNLQKCTDMPSRGSAGLGCRVSRRVSISRVLTIEVRTFSQYCRREEPSMKGQVELNTEGPIAKMVLSNPGRRNSITLSMWKDISRSCEEIKKLSSIRAVFLTGEGDDFASGADIGDVKNIQISEVHNIVEKAINDLEMLEIPVVCVIRGYALGGGLEIATVCDLRIASGSSRFGIPAAKRGIGITRPNTLRLVRLVGIARAKEILLMGETFTATTALQWGLVNEIVSEANIDKRSMEICHLLAKNAPLSLRASKENIRNAWPLLDWVGKDPAEDCDVSEDLQEGMRAFLGKRPPDFKGK